MLQTIGRTTCAIAVVAASAITLASAQAPSSSATVLGSDADIHTILAERIEAIAGTEDGVGMVVGVIGPQGRRIISYGHLNQADPRPLDGNTVFEIGSVTKAFTALLLADMVRKGEVALADPVEKYLPPDVKMPELGGHSITLADLATHTSGLPFMPDDVPEFNESAAREYGSAQLYQFLGRCQLPRNARAHWDYSNLGYWLLGQALASRAGTDYGSLLRTRVTAPMQMTSTSITVSAKLRTRLAVGHNAILQPASPFSAASIYAAMPAAGGLVSSVNDLLKFLSVALGSERSPLTPTIASMLSTRRLIDDETEQALGWVVIGKGDNQLVMHDGATWGYSSCVAWDPKMRIGVVVLSNQLASVSDIARHLLRPNFPLERPSLTKHAEIDLDSAVLDGYAGEYEVKDEGIFRIARQNNFLEIQLPTSWGLPKFRLRAENRKDFFVAELPVRITFRTESDGRVNGLLVYPPRGQHALSADRINSNQ